MPVRAPLDVDFEDRLIYGLTPQRFGYLAAAGLLAMTMWSGRVIPAPLRGGLCVVILLLGAVAAWGKLQGRGLDLYLLDLTAFVYRNYELRYHWPVRVGRLADPLATCASPGLDHPP